MPRPGSSTAQRHVPIDVPYSSSAPTTRKTPAYAARKRERQRKRQRSGTPIAPATSRRGRTVSPASPQPIAPTAATATSDALAHERGDREAAEIDEPVRGRDEQRQVVQPVRVDAPDERADHLADRRERDDAERLRAGERGQRAERGEQHEPGQRAERELPVEADLRVDREQRREIRGARRRRTSADAHRRYWTSCQLGVGSSSSSARPPCGSWYENSADSSSKPTSSFPAFTRWSSQAPRKTSFFSQ